MEKFDDWAKEANERSGKTEKQAAVVYPADHKLGMRVPLGGSDCAKCAYVDGEKCTNEVFIRWLGSDKIPAPVDEYCCDMFETKESEK